MRCHCGDSAVQVLNIVNDLARFAFPLPPHHHIRDDDIAMLATLRRAGNIGGSHY
jgi:hypothetical protein